MQASIITIGDEILIGQVVDTNSTFMAGEISKLGIKLNEIVSISDSREAIISTLNRLAPVSDIILVTGGLGPTKDDITKKVLAEFFDCKLIRHEATLKRIEKRMEMLKIPMTEINKGQADVPDLATVLNNNEGSAPGMLLKTKNGVLFSMPGVPFEMKDILLNEVIPYIKSNFKLPERIYKTFLTTGVPESTLSDRLEKFETNLPEGFSLAYLPSPGCVRLRMTASAENKKWLESEFSHQEGLLEQYLGGDLYGYDEDTLSRIIGDLLHQNGLTVATAESCSGGNIASTIVSVSGASEYFRGGVVTYSNKSKEDLLNVKKESLEQYGAVSKDVVIQMAENAKKMFQSDFGVATSGIAGPLGGTPDKPVGTVWIAISSPQRTIALKFGFGNSRDRNIIRSTTRALDLLRREILSVVKKTKNKV